MNINQKCVKKNYEVEINGLRGIAILLVCLFHYEIYPFSGGFLGVDIFFVISGYLIGKIINDKSFKISNYTNFLTNRSRRIFPGLFVMLVFSFFLFTLILSPDHFKAFSKSLISNLFLIPNFYFWTQSNYFDITSNYKPLLHTWSLGIEYQFYIIWPLVILFLKKIYNKIFLQNLFILILISFSIYANTFISSFGPVFENKFLYGFYVSDTLFFLFPFRLFEFMFGYIYSINKFRFNSKLINNIIFLIGLLLILHAVVTFQDIDYFPTLGSVYPIVGASLLIFAKNSNIANFILKNKLINYFGDISFSLYLYHWPILIFYKYLKFSELTNFEKFICFLFSVMFAHLSYKYIEKNYLSKKITIYKRKNFIFLITLMFICSSVIIYNGWSFRLNEFQKKIINSDFNKYGGICEMGQQNTKNADCYYGNQNSLDFIIVGDSHGKALYAGFKSFAKKNNLNFATSEDMCERYPSIYNNITNCITNFDIPEIIVIGKKFYDYQMPENKLKDISKSYVKNIYEIKENINFKNVKKIIVIGQVPEFYSSYGDLKSCYTRPFYINKTNCDKFFNKNIWLEKKNIVSQNQNHFLKAKLNKFLSNEIIVKNKNHDDLEVYFFDPFEYLCNDGVCLQVEDGKLIYEDDSHLSVFGSNYIINKIDDKLLEIFKD